MQLPFINFLVCRGKSYLGCSSRSIGALSSPIHRGHTNARRCTRGAIGLRLLLHKIPGRWGGTRTAICSHRWNAT